MNCPHCNEPLAIKVYKGKQRKERKRKNPYEPMSLEVFVEGCRKSKEVRIKIIGEWADELRESRNWQGPQTRGEWAKFLKANLPPAVFLSYTWSTNNGQAKIADAMKTLLAESEEVGFNFWNLDTLQKYVMKI